MEFIHITRVDDVKYQYQLGFIWNIIKNLLYIMDFNFFTKDP